MSNSRIAHLFLPTLYILCAIPIASHLLLAQMPYPESDAAYSSLYFMERDNDSADREQNPDLDELARQIVDRTNAFRKEHLLSPIRSDEQLKATASDFARFMAKTGKYGHTSDGNQPHERANLHSYEHCIVLENIAFKYNSEGITQKELLEYFVESWKQSPVHRENMLDPDVTQTGVAVRVSGKGYYYAVQMFGLPKAAMIKFEIANQADIPLEYTLGGQSFTLKPNRTHEQEICRKSAIMATVSGLRNPKSYIPESGDHFEYRRNHRGLYGFVLVNP